MQASSSVEEAEARAALMGLHTLAAVYKGPVEVEMDCKSVIKDSTSVGPCLSPCFGVICDIKETLALFTSHRFSSVGRECNALAHELVPEAR